MFLEHFKITGISVFQILLLSGIGFFLVKRSFLSTQGLDDLSRLVMDITLPLLIFCQILTGFSFSAYPDWWVFPLISIVITLTGLLIGFLFSGFAEKGKERRQFISLIAFQNSGYLPLALLAALLTAEKAAEVFIYIFLFLMGFNLMMFSLGVFILNYHEGKKFNIKSLLSAPVVATIFSLLIIYFGLNKFVPSEVLRPLRILGDTTLPLAMLVVGGSLAKVSLKNLNKRAITIVVLAKMVLLPLLGIVLLDIFNVSGLMGILIVVQLSMPSAVTISSILRAYKKEDVISSQGIFITHIFAVITIPLFLILYLWGL